ncbi:hypothetical protein, partial [Desulfobaculum xiamenense]|uniref:hypothetical protein n=1 Tax=Desulfobaculum xiamenense TaxID=995050 RepID=UPI001ADD6432
TRKPQAASRKPQAASRKPQAASRKPQAASRKPQAARIPKSPATQAFPQHFRKFATTLTASSSFLPQNALPLLLSLRIFPLDRRDDLF